MTEEEIEILKIKVAQLENENRLLKEGITSFLTVGKTVTVPEQFQPIFDEAEKTVGSYFQELKADPSKGSIEINDERYVLLRASSLSVDFLNKIKNLYADKGDKEAYLIGRKFLFDIAHVLGIEDAKNFHKKMNLKDPVSKLSAGPVHFAYSGWAYVDILPESNPSPDENFYLKYHHPFSFEADAWMKEGKKSEFPVCIMNAGYSSGWCEESFGIPLTAVEITCKAKGDENCTFIMAPPEKIESYLKEVDPVQSQSSEYDIPLFFERKKAEEKIISSLKEKDILLKEVHHRVKNNLQIVSSFLNLQSHFLPSDEAKDMFNETRNRVKALALVHEKLHGSSDVQYVDLGKYIQSIIDLLEYSYNSKHRMSVEIDCKSIEKFHIDIAIPCGLIINELVSNVFKYAFPDEKEGNIHVSLTEKDKTCKIVVKDDGVGFPNGLNYQESNSLGLEIVNSLVEQLDGELQLNSESGSEFIIDFTV